MNSCPPPDGSSLPAHHQIVLGEVLELLKQHQYKQSLLAPLLPGIVAKIAAVCDEEGGFEAWYNELLRWVRWYRVPAFKLTFIFQLVTLQQQSVYHFAACELYSDAQTIMAHDRALSSLETGYVTYMRNAAALGAPFAWVGEHYRHKLRYYYDFYRALSKPFDYMVDNPCTANPYHNLCHWWLQAAAREHDPSLDISKPECLSAIIAACVTDDVAFYRILAQHFLGLFYESQHQFALSVEQYEHALADARRLWLETEIGHLRRLLGLALRRVGHLDESRHHLEQALAYERLEPAFMFTRYWQALSARELGDTIMHQVTRPATAVGLKPGQSALVIEDPEKLRPALAAYHDGRMMLSSHLSVDSPFPLARAAKQQLFRSFSTNAVRVAAVLQSTHDMLAEVEWSGPRQATELVTEIAAVRRNKATPLADFRRGRAAYYKTLTTIPGQFETYLDSIVQLNHVRRGYLQESVAFDASLMESQQCDAIAERAMSLRIPDAIFLLFHVGVQESLLVLMDGSSGLAAPFPALFGEQALRDIHAEYQESVRTSGLSEAAIDRLLAQYSELLGPLLEPILRFLPGRHLKVFPRLHMSAVPLHALRVGGKFLIEHCAAFSYGQTLGLFLENHQSSEDALRAPLRVVVGERVPLYELILQRVAVLHAGTALIERPKTWAELTAAMTQQPATDTMFACHGRYAPDDPERSLLELTAAAGGAVSFDQMFAELDLRGRRSVIMGACESGLARTEIDAEYIGLPSAMLASGVRYVVGALWTIPQLATAVLTLRLLEGLRTDGVCTALHRAQCAVMTMTRDELSAWFSDLMSGHPELPAVLRQIGAMPERPFAHPFHWAGLHVIGDV